MAVKKSPAPKVETFADYQVITPVNSMKRALRQVADDDKDDPIARAEQALADLSGEFNDWMATECDRLAAAHAMVVKQGFTQAARDELFRATHDIKGDAATFGYPAAAGAASSLCRILEHAPDLDRVPDDLIAHHVSAILAIVREHARIDRMDVADELSTRLSRMADKYLIEANAERPEHLEAVMAPSIVPGA